MPVILTANARTPSETFLLSSLLCCIWMHCSGCISKQRLLEFFEQVVQLLLRMTYSQNTENFAIWDSSLPIQYFFSPFCCRQFRTLTPPCHITLCNLYFTPPPHGRASISRSTGCAVTSLTVDLQNCPQLLLYWTYGTEECVKTSRKLSS